ncbi:MAG TPA: hypothetical protein PKK26_14150 [Candidatus Wallbacteria bacterium]|nr:hypothetical protein [Candidatus Wallbacteria bacterium]
MKKDIAIKYKNLRLFLIVAFAFFILFSQIALASANPLLWPLAPVKAFFSGANFVAQKIADVVSPPKINIEQAGSQSGESFTISDDLLKRILEQNPAASSIISADDLKNIISAKLNTAELKNAASVEAALLNKKLNVLEKLYDEGSVDIAEAVAGGNGQSSQSQSISADAPNPDALLNKAIVTAAIPKIDFNQSQQPATSGQGASSSAASSGAGSGLISQLKDQDPNSAGFKSIFEKFKEQFKPETKSYLEYSTSSSNAKKVLPPDFEVKGGSSIKIWQDKLEDNQLANKTWSYGDKPQSSIASSYTSNFLNTKDDPALAQKTLVTGSNKDFNNVRLEQGSTKFGWTHIAYDRSDGTCHAREIKEAFGLANQDEAVRNFILDTIKTGNAEEQVRQKGGADQHRMLYTKNVNGQEILVVVDNDDKYRGSVITAYPTGNVKAPTPDEIQKRIAEEKAKLAEAAKKNERWKNPSISVDFYRNEIGKTIGPQVKAGAESQFKLGGATVTAGAKGDVLLIGAEAKGASYVGIRYGQLAAGVQGSVFAGSRARGEVSTGIQAGQWGGRVFAGGEATAGVGANADAHVGVGKEGAEASVSGDAFVGVRAKGQVGGTISHGNTSVTGSVNGTVGAGLGAHFEATGKISWTGIKAKVNVGAYLGIGGQLGFDINVNFGDALKPVQQVVGKVYDAGKKIAQTVGTNIKNTIDNGKKTLEKLFNW